MEDVSDDTDDFLSPRALNSAILKFFLDEVVQAWIAVFTQLLKPLSHLVTASATLYNVMEAHRRDLLPQDSFLFHGNTFFQWQVPVDFLELTLRFFEKYSVLDHSFDNFFCKREVDGFEMHHIDVHIDSNCDSLTSCLRQTVQGNSSTSLCSANSGAPSVIAIGLNRIQFAGENKHVLSNQSIKLKDTIEVGGSDTDIPLPILPPEEYDQYHIR